MRKTLLALATAAAALLATPALAANLIEVATANGTMTKFLESVEAAGLTSKLKGPGPFTVFVPSDNGGFQEIEEGGEFEELIANKAKIAALVNYHIVPGKFMAADLKTGMKLKTAQGGELAVTTTGSLKINGSKVIVTDLPASNGVLYLIEQILSVPQ
jgi:uncharacterized surface protein with fasciclin (FAS1) repeats